MAWRRGRRTKPAGPFEIPDRSVLVVRATGAGIGALSSRRPGSDGGTRSSSRRRRPANATDVSELKLEVRKSGTVTVYGGGTPLLSWPFQVDARPSAQDRPHQGPRADAARRPQAVLQGRGRLRRGLRRGAASAACAPRRTRPRPPGPAPAPRRARVRRYERPPALALRLPRAYPKQAEGQSFHEIGDHPWAGMKVELTLIAKDLAGQTGRSEPIEIVLPERRFIKPLARAVVEQRRRLVEDPRDRLQVARAHRGAHAGARGVHRGPAGVSRPALGLLAPAARRHARRRATASSRSCGTSPCASRTATSPTPSGRCAPPRSGCRRRWRRAPPTRKSRS